MSKINNLEIMPESGILLTLPTSELIFYNTHKEKSDYLEDDINKVLTNRLIRKYKLNAKRAYQLINRDEAIISFRGNRLEEYIFNYSDYNSSKSLKDIYLEKRRNFDDLYFESICFSELCLYSQILFNRSLILHRNNKVLKREVKEKKRILLDKKTSTFDANKIGETIYDLDSIKSKQEENKKNELECHYFQYDVLKYIAGIIDIKLPSLKFDSIMAKEESLCNISGINTKTKVYK